MGKKKASTDLMTAGQQRRAVKILKGIVKTDDEQNPGQSGYCDHSDTHEIRMLLIECGALPDRREAKKGARHE
jgi:hypothetical protein